MVGGEVKKPVERNWPFVFIKISASLLDSQGSGLRTKAKSGQTDSNQASQVYVLKSCFRYMIKCMRFFGLKKPDLELWELNI